MHHVGFAFAMMAAGLGLAPAAGAERSVTFEALRVERPVTTFSLTEDGRFLVLAHEQDNRISVWDVAAGRRVRERACPSPRFVLCRGDRVYVACYGRGAIRVFQPSQDWKGIDELGLDLGGVYYLSAAQGKWFGGKILATCSQVGDQPNVLVVDARRDRSAPARPKGYACGLATVSARGRHVLEQGNRPGDPNCGSRLHELAPYVGGKRGRGMSAYISGRLGYQGPRGRFWFGGPHVAVNTPPNDHRRWAGMLAVPDQTREAYYVLGKDAIQACRLDMSSAQIAVRPAKLPAELLARYGTCADDWRYGSGRKRPWTCLRPDKNGYTVCAPAAATVGGRLHLFLLDLHTGKLWHARTAAMAAAGGDSRGAVSGKENGFHVLPTPGPATSMTLTEDSRHLVVSQWTTDTVTVWDVATGRLVKTLGLAQPCFALCRGESIYVACATAGVVWELRRDRDFKQVARIELPEPGVYFLSAARGEHFDGKILATSAVLKPLSVRRGKVYLVDTRAKRVRLLRHEERLGSAVMDSRGRHVIECGGYGYNSYGAAAYLGGQIRGQPRRSTGLSATDTIVQAGGDGRFWLTRSGIAAGPPISLLGRPLPDMTGQPDKVRMRMLIPDQTRLVFYALCENAIRVHRLDETLAALDTRAVKTPRWLSAVCRGQIVPGGLRPSPSPHVLVVCEPLAATLDRKLYVFVPLGCAGGLLRCVVGAFDVSVQPKPPAAPKDAFPPRIAQGRPFTWDLAPKHPGATFTLMKGPSGLTVSPEGKLAWTPGVAAVGPHKLKIRAAAGGEASFLRFELEVVRADVADRAGGDMTAVDTLGAHDLLHDDYHLTPALDGRGILLLAGEQLRILDADGLKVLRKAKLPAWYRRIHERDRYFVLVGNQAVDLVDKTSLQVTKRIKLDGIRTLDLAACPKRPTCFISMNRNSPNAYPQYLRKVPIYVIDEKAGRARLVRGLFGQRLAVDPRGLRLFVIPRGRRDQKSKPFFRGNLPRTGDYWGQTLISWALAGDRVGLGKVVEDGLRGCRRVVFRPDGRSAALLCDAYHTKDHQLPGLIPVVNMLNPSQRLVTYRIDGRPVAVAFHPAGKLAAASNGTGVVILNAHTGRPAGDKVDFAREPLKDVRNLMFSPSGRSLLVDFRSRDGRRRLRAFALK